MEEGNKKQSATQVVKEIKRRTRRKFTAEETGKYLEKDKESKRKLSKKDEETISSKNWN